jgi:hypothetical protein
VRALLAAAALCGVLTGCAGTAPTDERFPDVARYEGCKDVARHSTPSARGRTEACIVYSYDGVLVLRLTHVNTAFNCTPDEVGGEVHVTPWERIYVVEDEYAPVPADCLCLFDVEYEIHGVPPGHYRLTVDEMYSGEGNEEFDFELDLTAPCAGDTCLPRTGYPWDGPWK